MLQGGILQQQDGNEVFGQNRLRVMECSSWRSDCAEFLGKWHYYENIWSLLTSSFKFLMTNY